MPTFGGLRGFISAGVRNPVLANLAMACILVGGLLSVRRMVRETYPEFSLEHIAIEVAYPGASPPDVERAICTPIEEAVAGLSGVLEISSSANENFGVVWVRVHESVKDSRDVLKAIKDEVDQIITFPTEAEKPVISEKVIRNEVINIAVYGNVGERTLKRMAQEVKTDLLADPAITQVSLSGVRDDEIIVEVSDEALAAYNLSLERVMAVIARSSLDLPAGAIRSADEELTLRITGQRLAAADYEDMVVVEHRGTVVRLGEIATVREGFEEIAASGRFKGEPAALVAVFKTPEQDASEIARIVREYVEARQAWLPERLNMAVWADRSLEIDSRIRMLVTNGAMGIALVFLTLALFLEVRLAFWVAAGIPISFAGALIIINALGETLNMVSLFALIMVCGIIVDDAIVIGESVHARRRGGTDLEIAAIEGTSRVALPVLGASLTTIAAFAPLLYVIGVMGRFIHVLPVVVIAAVTASAFEAFGILPAHLCYRQPPGVQSRPDTPGRARLAIEGLIERFITRGYRPIYRLAMKRRVVTVAIACSAMFVVLGLVLGGRTPLVLLPTEDASILRARIRFPEGTPASVTQRTINRIEEAALKLNQDPELVSSVPGGLVRQYFSNAGEFADFLPVRGNNLLEVRIELIPPGQRKVKDDQIIERWRHHIGPVYDATEYTITRQHEFPTDRPIEIRLFGSDLEDMIAASERIQNKLGEFEGISNIRHDLVPGKRELRVTLQPAARPLGLTLEDVGRQLRHGFFGGEALQLQRGRDLVKVRVRYPESERRSIANLEGLRVSTPIGDEIPFPEVANVEWSRGYTNIMHQDGKRRLRLWADLDERRVKAEQVLQVFEAGFLDDVVDDYNDMTWEFGGNRAQMNESLESLFDGFTMAMVVIYAILASMLRSYLQPVVIIAAVPFGFVGATVGHALMGFDLTMMSLFGLVALSGVVVNDSLVLMDAINRGISEGKNVREAVFNAGEQRFRAVTLTSITTVAGLLPLLTEPSGQAQSVRPMAVSLAFGILFATVLTLFVVPALYLLLNDIRRFVHWLRYGGNYPAAELVEEASRRQVTSTA